MRSKLQLSGRKINTFKIIKLVKETNNNKRRYWECLCDCGKTMVIRQDKIISTKCHRNNKTHHPNVGKYVVARYCGYKKRAREKGIRFELTIIDFKDLLNNNCYYCGSPPEENKGTIDRINSSGGYIKGNIVSACLQCNVMKSDMRQSDFINLANKITRYQSGRIATIWQSPER